MPSEKQLGQLDGGEHQFSASNGLINLFHIIHPMVVLHNNIHKDRWVETAVGSLRDIMPCGTDKSTRIHFLTGKGSSHRPIFSLCALCHRSQVQI